MPAVLVVVSTVGYSTDAISAEFLGHFATRLGGGPLLVTLLAAGSFYLYCWGRGVSVGVDCFAVAVAALAFVRSDALTLGELDTPQPVLLVAGVFLLAWVWLWRQAWWRLAAAGVVSAAWVGLVAWRVYRELREEFPGLDYVVTGLVLLPLAVLMSLVNGGVVSRWMRRWLSQTPTPTG